MLKSEKINKENAKENVKSRNELSGANSKLPIIFQRSFRNSQDVLWILHSDKTNEAWFC